MHPENQHGAAQESAGRTGRRGARAAGLLLCCLGLVGTVVFGGLLFSTVYGAQAWGSTEEAARAEQRLAEAAARLAERDDEDADRDEPAVLPEREGEATAPAHQPAVVTAPTPTSTPAPTRPPLRVLVPDPSTRVQAEAHPARPSPPQPSPPPAADMSSGGPGQDEPTTPVAESPPAPPGPVSALGFPRLRIQTSVVQVGWEPPAYVAGQINTTAALGVGNSVIVGHRRGHAGDVFARLVGARLGDEVVAASDGDERRYVVSAIHTLPGSDVTPMAPSETPRVTLMTCVGDWNPLTGDYSHRLWVVAEPADLARATLTATVARATETAATAPSPADALRARTEALVARAALSVMDAEARRRR